MSGPNWSEVRPGLVAILTELAQSPQGVQPQGWAAEWRDGQRKATPNSGLLKGVTLTMRITSCIGIGDDDNRFEQATADSDLQENIYGLRRVTLNLQCEATEISDSQWAMSVLERIRTRLRRQRIIDALLDLNVGIVRILATTDISAKRQQHTLSRANLDVILTLVSCDADPVTTGWISSVVITNELHDVDGTVLPPPPDTTTTITTP